MNENIIRYIEDQRTIRKLKRNNIILFCGAIFIFGAFMYLSYLLIQPNLFSLIESKEVVSEPELIKECSNLSLVSTSECLRNELSKFYFYNLSQAGKDLTTEELKESGGVCEHWARWWRDRFISLGAKLSNEGDIYYLEKNSSKFYVKEIIFPMNNETSHAVTIASSSEGTYCLLDQLNIKCVELKI